MDPKKTTAVPPEIVKELRKIIIVSPKTGGIYYKGSDKKFHATYWIISKNLFSKTYRDLDGSPKYLEKGKEEHKPIAKELPEKNRDILVSRVEELIEGLRKKEIILVDLNMDGMPPIPPLLDLLIHLKYLFKITRDYEALDDFIKDTFNTYYGHFRTIQPEKNIKDTKKLIELLQK